MNGAPLLLALTAGMVGAINPCGFSLLPAYVGFFVTGENTSMTAERRMLRAVSSSAAVTVGFVAVFVVLGTALSSVTSSVQSKLPWVTIGVGAVLVVAGVLSLTGRTLPLPQLGLRAARGRGPVAMATYGAVYALASLSCTIGPFLAISAAGFAGSRAAGLATYATYGIGMGVVILAVACCAAVARPRPVEEMRRFSRHAVRAGGALMVLSGAYAIWYARWELAVYSGDLRTNRVVQFGESWRLAAVGLVERIGAAELAAVIVALAAAAVFVAQLRADRTGGDEENLNGDPTAAPQ